jgi:hypothetical protein
MVRGKSLKRSFCCLICIFSKATIGHLRARKQRYKLKMFQRLHLVLLFAVLVVIAFFVVSSMSFSGRLAEGSWSLFLLFFSSHPIFYRLCCEDMAPSMVASGWLAGPPLFRLLHRCSNYLAPQCKQPQISFYPFIWFLQGF